MIRPGSFLLALLLLLVACQSRAAAPVAVAQPTATLARLPTATLAPTATTPAPATTTPGGATPTPTASPSPMASMTPAPTATLELYANDFGLTVPRGVRVALYAERLPYPIVMALGEPGVLYASLNHGIYPVRPVGEIRRFLDVDGDGLADHYTSFAEGLDRPLGLLFHEGWLYVSVRGGVQRLRDSSGDGRADEVETIISGLPAFGLHQNNALRLGPDGKLYLTLGSATNHGPEENPLNATILRANLDGSALEIFASGLRNPFDIVFDAQGNLFATDNGCDPPACPAAPEELNHIIQGEHYGFPGVVGAPTEPGTRGPVATFPPHASANGMIVYNGAMFPEWQGDLFVAYFGSYLAGFTEVGRRVVRVELRPDGESFQSTVHPFVEGLARPLGLLVAPDGAILVTDFEAGRIYRLYR